MSDATAYVLDFSRMRATLALLHFPHATWWAGATAASSKNLPKNYTPRGVAGFRCRKGMAVARRSDPRNRSPRGIAGSDRRTSPRTPWKRTCGKGSARRGARKSDSQESRSLAAPNSDRGRHAARQRTGWPNTYTFTKSLSESLIRNFLDANPQAAIAVVRPAIVESSVEKPFLGWNEGINTSASLSYLLGTFFRQLPTNESKCLDLIPVDLVCRGMTLICRRACGAPPRARLSAGDVGGESLQHAPLHRTDRPGPPQVSIARRMDSSSACA